jgi:hypothetical protein
MTIDKLTEEEKIISDRLDSFFKDLVHIHILLKRTNQFGANIFLNGTLTKKSTDKVWILQERVLGEIRVSISEIKDVEEER